MIKWVCPDCFRVHITSDNIVHVFCPVCLSDMYEIEQNQDLIFNIKKEIWQKQ